MSDESIERDIVIGFVVSKDFVQRMRTGWDSSLLTSDAARYLVDWCVEFFDNFGHPPGTNIRALYEDKLVEGKIKPELGEEIEEDILPGLNEEYIQDPRINVDYLEKRTRKFLRKKRLRMLDKQVREKISAGDIDGAESLVLNYNPISREREDELDFHGKDFDQKLYNAFTYSRENILYYPGALGEMLNRHLIPSGFIAFMGINKVGKTQWLLDMALRGFRQGNPVAFFQAGDLTRNDFIVRSSVYLSHLPYYEEDVGTSWQPRRDCIWNQIDQCRKVERESDHGIFNSMKDDLSDFYRWRNKKNLLDAKKKFPDYYPCTACTEYHKNPWGTPWMEKKELDRSLTYEEAQKVYNDYLTENKHGFRVATYSNGSLSVPLMESRLDLWRNEGFVPKIIVVDYADYLVSHEFKEYRHQQNDVWAKLRGLSQDRDALVITVTQADAQAFSSSILRLKNFSEDRRKFDHPTAFLGINRDPAGTEKQMGLARFNELAIREGYFDSFRQVTVLQNLTIGRPMIGSYWSNM